MNSKSDSLVSVEGYVRSLDSLRKLLKRLHDTSMPSWRKIAQKPVFRKIDIPFGTLATFTRTGYLPKIYQEKLRKEWQWGINHWSDLPVNELREIMLATLERIDDDRTQ